MNKKIIILTIICMILITNISFAVEFTPQGDMNGRSRYSIKNFIDVNATRFFQNGSVLLGNDTQTLGGTTCTDTQIVAYNTSSSTWVCADQGSGTGDITEVNTNGAFLSGGATTGAANLFWNDTKGNATYMLKTGDTVTGDYTITGDVSATALDATNLTISQISDSGYNTILAMTSDGFSFADSGSSIMFYSDLLSRLQVDETFYVTQNQINSKNMTADYFLGNGSQLTSVDASTWDGIDTPTDFTTVTASGIITAGQFSGPLNWTFLQNYPSACPAGTFATQIGDTITCTAPTAADIDPGTYPSGDYAYQGQLNTSTFYVSSNAEIVGNLDIGGDLNVTGNIDLGQDLTVGDDGVFRGDVIIDGTLSIVNESYIFNSTIVNTNGSIIPALNSVYDLGNSSQRWDEIHANDGYFNTEVGIGTNNPQSILNINGGVGTISTGLSFGDGDTGFYESSDDNLKAAIGGSEIFLINNNWALLSSKSGGGGIADVTPSTTIPAFTFRDDSNTGIGTGSADSLSLITAGSERINIDSSGNVGISATTPGSKLEVAGTISTSDASGPSIVNEVSSSTNPVFIPLNTEETTGYGGISGVLYGIVAGVQKLQLAATQIILNPTGADTNLRVIDSSSNDLIFADAGLSRVGIGTSNPTSQLEVNGGDILINNTGTSTALRFARQSDGASIQGLRLDTDDDLTVGSSSFDNIRFDVGNIADAFFIEENTGRVGIGLDTPSTIFHVNLSTADVVMRLQKGESGTYDIVNEGGRFSIQEGGTRYMTIGNSGGMSVATDSAYNNPTANYLLVEGNVGIGLNNPADKLHVSTTGDSEALVIDDSTGRTSIGTTTATSILNIEGDRILTFVGGNAVITASTNQLSLTGAPINLQTTEIRTLGNGYGAGLNVGGVGNKPIAVFRQDAASNSDQFRIQNSSGTTRFVVDESFNVGIGVSNPTKELEVDGDIEVTSGNDICISGGNCLSTAGGGGGSGIENGSQGNLTRLYVWDATNPKLSIFEADEGTNEKAWEIEAAGGILYIASQNDAFGDRNGAIQIFKSASSASVDKVTFPSGEIGIGTNNPSASYKLDVNGATRSSDYYSGDGTQGATTSCGPSTTITVKDGLITACS